MPEQEAEAAGGPGTAGVPGVLRPDGAAGRFTLARRDPPGDLAPLLDWFWIVRWDVRGQPPYEQRILSHPNVHLVFEADGPRVYGVDTRVYTRRLTGEGKVLGIRFRSGCFRPFCSVPVATLTDRVVPAATFLGPSVDAANEAVMAAAGDEEMIAGAVRLLRAASPPRDPVAEEVASMVDAITKGGELRRVGELAGSFGMSERRMQRLFTEYVGVSPKRVMRRARLHEAALRADSGEAVDWRALASDLGYSDQAHLTRDFTATIGTPPGRYLRHAAPPAAGPSPGGPDQSHLR
jgi:AraC-like DNA-binding protein